MQQGSWRHRDADFTASRVQITEGSPKEGYLSLPRALHGLSGHLELWRFPPTGAVPVQLPALGAASLAPHAEQRSRPRWTEWLPRGAQDRRTQRTACEDLCDSQTQLAEALKVLQGLYRHRGIPCENQRRGYPRPL